MQTCKRMGKGFLRCSRLTKKINNFPFKVLANKNILQHRKNAKYGENLFMAGGTETNGKDPVKSWYDEIQNYRFSSGGFSSTTGHFTQVIWKNSKELGIGVENRSV